MMIFKYVELFENTVAAIATVFFTGFIAYWTRYRDQEHIRVQKILLTATTIEGKQVPTRSLFEILVINLSLFPVHICAVGLTLPDGSPYQFKKVSLSFLSPCPMESTWSIEIPSYGRKVFYSGDNDLTYLEEKGVSYDSDFFKGHKCKAIAKTEAGREFYSK